MTQIAFVRRLDLPSKDQLEKKISELGYDLKFKEEFGKFDNLQVLDCSLRKEQTVFEVYFESIDEIINNYPDVRDKVDDKDYTISFIWGANFMAGASIAIISMALIELCDSIIYYADDNMIYTKEMLLEDLPEYFDEFEEIDQTYDPTEMPKVYNSSKHKEKKSLWFKISRLWS